MYRRVGHSAWGRRMRGKRGGPTMTRHSRHAPRKVPPRGLRASVIARERPKAREAFEREQRECPKVKPSREATHGKTRVYLRRRDVGRTRRGRMDDQVRRVRMAR